MSAPQKWKRVTRGNFVSRGHGKWLEFLRKTWKMRSNTFRCMRSREVEEFFHLCPGDREWKKSNQLFQMFDLPPSRTDSQFQKFEIATPKSEKIKKIMNLKRSIQKMHFRCYSSPPLPRCQFCHESKY